MTGTLLEVGFHRMQPNDVITILQGKKEVLQDLLLRRRDFA